MISVIQFLIMEWITAYAEVMGKSFVYFGLGYGWFTY